MHAHMHNTYFLQGLATHFLSTINTYSSAKSIKEPLRKLQNCHAWWDLTNKNQSTHLRSVWTQGTPKSKSLSSVSPSNLPCGGWIHHFRILYHIVGTKIYHYNIPTIVAFIVILPHKITSGPLGRFSVISPLYPHFLGRFSGNCSVFESWWKPGRLEYPPTG
jgi:hypothetical protein